MRNEPKTYILVFKPNLKQLKKIGKFCHVIRLNDSYGIYAFNCRNSYKRHIYKFNLIA